MMQNSSIIYHPESLNEMQIICLVIFWMLNAYIIDNEPANMKKHLDESGEMPQVNFLLYALLVEHIGGYLLEIFRQYDIEKNGQLDAYGVPRAKTESLLGSLHYFVICLILGYAFKTIMGMDDHIFKQLSFALLWIVVDAMIMLFTRLYIALALYLKISGEVTKNIYTVHFLQKRLRQ